MSDIPFLDTRPPAGLTPGSVAANKRVKRLRRLTAQAITDDTMIRDGHRPRSVRLCRSEVSVP